MTPARFVIFRSRGMAERKRTSQGGFTLLELAIGLVIIGLLAGGGLAIYTTVSDQVKREETAQYMETVRRSLLIYGSINKRLPRADYFPPAGIEDTVAEATIRGELPYKEIGVAPYDAWGRRLKYAVNWQLTTSGSCLELKAMILGSAVPENSPRVWDATGGVNTANPMRFGVVIVSAGPRDADGDGSVFDGSYDIGPPESGGNNNHLPGTSLDGPPFLRRRPEYSETARFDDLVIYIGAPTLYDWMKCTN